MGSTELKIENEKIPEELIKFLRSLPNSTVYQYIFTAYPSANITIPRFVDIDLQKIFFTSLEEWEKKYLDKINELNISLLNKDEMIHLSNDKNNFLNEQNNLLNEQNTLLNEQNNLLNEKNNQLAGTNLSLQDELSKSNISLMKKDELIIQTNQKNNVLLAANLSLQDELTRLKNSITWQLVTKFHLKIIERYFSPWNEKEEDFMILAGKVEKS